MPLRPEHILLAALLACPLSLAAQENPVEEPGPLQPAGQADAEAEAVAPPEVSEEVKESQPPAPTDQGMLQTEELDEDEEEAEQDVTLYAVLSDLRRSPPGLDGEPIPRPNPLASEPTLEMDPAQPRDAYLFPEGYIE